MPIKYYIGGTTRWLDWPGFSHPTHLSAFGGVHKNTRTMAHIWWSCPRACRLWVRTYALLRNLFHVDLKRDPYEALLGKSIVELLERQLAQHLFAVTKLTIARAWKTPALSFEVVKNRMNYIMVNEKRMAILLDTHIFIPPASTVRSSQFSTPPDTFPVDSSLSPFLSSHLSVSSLPLISYFSPFLFNMLYAFS